MEKPLFNLPAYYYSRFYHCLLPILSKLPVSQQIKIASRGRLFFMQQFSKQKFIQTDTFSENNRLSKTLWGIKFRTPLGNSAGMFKNGEGYDTVAKLGAGFYIGGTSTANPRNGNSKNGIDLPFISLPKSGAAINWLGLPNLGDDKLHKKIITESKLADCPIGWSVMRSPDYAESEGIEHLINSLWLYHDNPQIDFLELNESCPNIKAGGGNIIPRIEQISIAFLQKRQRKLPIILKISNDIDENALVEIIHSAINLGFDGINLGNTSTNYVDLRHWIDLDDRKLFDYFTQTFGGGVSGKVLGNNSLTLCATAVNEVRRIKPQQEFHVIRSGGINSPEDIVASEKIGVSLNQWYTGFFDNYTRYGNNVYKNLYAGK
ncbi:hypothetical protein CUN60_01410 [Aquella oligotrophica]|uniref:Dihydroorotate dehydrogenase catalytic domain-containing protein n=2 Tax=Aquella oligotrophica TaxID=2067065 RepID=A0A2I7N475_9NEIS|nr:hypothetical protein CUN60_01410 [Aquella oligotrophica]